MLLSLMLLWKHFQRRSVDGALGSARTARVGVNMPELNGRSSRTSPGFTQTRSLFKSLAPDLLSLPLQEGAGLADLGSVCGRAAGRVGSAEQLTWDKLQNELLV